MGVGLISAVASILGHYIGAGLAIKNGSKIVKPTVIAEMCIRDRAYVTVSRFCPYCWGVLLLGNMVFHYGILPLSLIHIEMCIRDRRGGCPRNGTRP